MSPSEVFVQQLITGLSNGMIIALIALGYTMVYGIIGLINFAHGDLFMLGAFLALAIVGALIPTPSEASVLMVFLVVVLATISSAIFCGALNVAVDQIVYRPL